MNQIVEGNDGVEHPYPTEFSVPDILITPSEISHDLVEFGPSIKVDIGAPGQRVSIMPGYETADPDNLNAEGYVYFGRAVGKLNGTYMTPEVLFEILEPQNMTGAEARALLLGDRISQDGPLVTLASQDGLVNVHVYGGSTNPSAVTLSEIGDAGTFGPLERTLYQHAVHDTYIPIARRPRSKTKAALGITAEEIMFHDQEDCGASFITLGGVGIVEEHMFPGHVPPRRIDLAVATGQALTGLTVEAVRRRQPTEINIGYASWGLSRGIGPNLEHKNYLTHAPIPELQRVFKTVFVVGDMGDAGSPVEGVPWHAYRRDTYQSASSDGSFVEYSEQGRDMRFAYARGGHFIVAITEHIQDQAGFRDDSTLTMAIAKRLDSPLFGFALRLDKFRESVLSRTSGKM